MRIITLVLSTNIVHHRRSMRTITLVLSRNTPSSIDEDYYARVKQEHSPLLLIGEDYYVRVEQGHSSPSSIDDSVMVLL